jgi:hypothetical protein
MGLGEKVKSTPSCFDFSFETSADSTPTCEGKPLMLSEKVSTKFPWTYSVAWRVSNALPDENYAVLIFCISQESSTPWVL